jgi:hypothetical protein
MCRLCRGAGELVYEYRGLRVEIYCPCQMKHLERKECLLESTRVPVALPTEGTSCSIQTSLKPPSRVSGATSAAESGWQLRLNWR